jgi:hypothetical protein
MSVGYVRNSELTVGHVKRIAFKCGYDVLTPITGCVFAVQTPSGEIVGFRDLPGARRFLLADLTTIRAERMASWLAMWEVALHRGGK